MCETALASSCYRLPLAICSSGSEPQTALLLLLAVPLISRYGWLRPVIDIAQQAATVTQRRRWVGRALLTLQVAMCAAGVIGPPGMGLAGARLASELAGLPVREWLLFVGVCINVLGWTALGVAGPLLIRRVQGFLEAESSPPLAEMATATTPQTQGPAITSCAYGRI